MTRYAAFSTRHIYNIYISSFWVSSSIQRITIPCNHRGKTSINTKLSESFSYFSLSNILLKPWFKMTIWMVTFAVMSIIAAWKTILISILSTINLELFEIRRLLFVQSRVILASNKPWQSSYQKVSVYRHAKKKRWFWDSSRSPQKRQACVSHTCL